MTKERYIDKLRKLLNHQKSAEEIGSLAEAEAFAARINELLLQHQISLSEVEAVPDDPDEVIDQTRVRADENGLPFSPRRVPWMERLASTVAHANLCKILVVTGRNTVFFVGRPVDREVAVYTYVTLAQAAVRMAERQLRMKKRLVDLVPVDLTGFKASFYEGFVTGISRRLREMRQTVEQDNPGSALVLQSALVRVQQHIDKLCEGKKSAEAIGGGGGFNEAGYNAGKSYAEKVSLGIAAASGPKMIGGK